MSRWRGPLLAALVPALAGCEGIQSVLDPEGYGAERIADLWWFMFGLGALVWVVVAVLAVRALYARRTVGEDRPIPERTAGDDRRTRWVAGGIGATVAILLGVFLHSLLTGRAIHGIEREDALTIEVVGHRWWWEVRYLDPALPLRFETANELHVPVGRPVRVLLRTGDVIHSFWVPNLSGKTDMIPGRTNTLWLLAEEPGVYRGQCAEFCGLQHAKMAFMVVASPPDEFEAWMADQRRPARPPGTELEQAGLAVFLSRGCVLCHAVRGTDARGEAGPDLTHLASRLTLAAGTLPNTIGHLGGWIGNPQVIKPGNQMPRVPLESEELLALLAYLESLD